MEETKKELKVYRETTFWSHLNGGRVSLLYFADVALRDFMRLTNARGGNAV